MLRRLRGLFGLAIAWGIAWVPLGIAVAIIDAITRSRALSVGDMIKVAPVLAAIGAFSGFAFALLFTLVERNRTFGSLTIPRAIAWGVAGAAIYPVTALVASPFGFNLGAAAMVFPPFVLLGAISAGGTLVIARRAPTELHDPDTTERLEPSK